MFDPVKIKKWKCKNPEKNCTNQIFHKKQNGNA